MADIAEWLYFNSSKIAGLPIFLRGIMTKSANPFPVGNKGYSIVVSFKLIKNNKNNNEKEKLTIFSFKNKDKNQNIMNVYIENNQVKIDMGKLC